MQLRRFLAFKPLDCSKVQNFLFMRILILLLYRAGMNSSATIQYLSGKNITDCTSNSYEYTYTNISQITVKTRIRSTESSFYIFIYQSGIDLSSNAVVQRSRQILEILAISIIACFIFLILTIFIFAICKKKVFAKSKKFRYGKKVGN